MKTTKIIIILIMGCLFMAGCNKKTPDNAKNNSQNSNIAGLIEYSVEGDESINTYTLSFSYLGKEDLFHDTLISESDYVEGLCPYGYFSFDEITVIKEDTRYYVKLSCDKRIQVTCISFNRADERLNIYPQDDLKLVYCDFKDASLTKRTSQSYNAENCCWGNIHYEEEVENTSERIQYDCYEMLAIDSQEYEPSNELNGTTIYVTDYRFTNERYNIYGEIEAEKEVSLSFYLSGENVNSHESNDFTLLIKSGDHYVDITPADVVLTFDYKEKYDGARNLLNITMQSNLLGELQEGDYRILYDSYPVDFKMMVQMFEVW